MKGCWTGWWLVAMVALAWGAYGKVEGMDEKVVESTLAGEWYEADAGRLRAVLEGLLAASGEEKDMPPPCRGVIVPHAGYAYSGKCAARGIRAVAALEGVRRVVVIGFSHRVALPGMASVPTTETGVRSPLGVTPLDREGIERLSGHPRFVDVPATRVGENSVELQIPLLQAALAGREWRVLPVTLGQLDAEGRREVAAALRPLMNAETAWVVSSDFTHYGEGFGYIPFRENVEEGLRKLDGGAVERILAGDAEGFEGYCERTGATICGRDSIGVWLELLPNGFTGTELAYETSGAQTGNFRHSVSYACLGFHWPEEAAAAAKREPETASAGDAAEVLTATEKRTLLKLARRQIEGALKGDAPYHLRREEVTSGMRKVMGAFVTLTIEGDLRGCIGEIQPVRPLFEAVSDRALDAAFSDPRFPQMTLEEWPDVRIEISALTPPRSVGSWKEIEIGRHGMTIELDGRMAVYLPQVAPEQGWTLEETLTSLSRKAGLSGRAWLDPRAKFKVFEAVVFSEGE